MPLPFDAIVKPYDHWYESPKGEQVFAAEFNCLQHVCPECEGRWLEVGAGTGRFAGRMGIKEGIDPSGAMLELAASRGITTYRGRAEALPFEANTFDGILMALTLCFIERPEKALSQCHGILKPNGQLLIGLVPAVSSWGIAYQEKKKRGHPIYSHAHFLTIERTIAIAERSGFKLKASAGTLFCKPNELLQSTLSIERGIYECAGFAALLFIKAR